MNRGRAGILTISHRWRLALLTALSAAVMLWSAGAARAAGPTVTVSPTAGTPGTALTVTGSGWHAGDSIFVQIGSSSFDQDVACVLTAHANGSISGDSTAGCQVPNVQAGSDILVAIDEQNMSLVAHGANFAVSPVLVLTPTNAGAGSPTSPGTAVAIGGHGFAASSTVAGFKFDGAAVATSPSSVTTDANGNFTATVTFTVPAAAAASNHTVSATDASAHSGSGTLRVFRATVALSTTSGNPGGGLTVTGGGWPAGDHIFVQIGSLAFDNNVVCALTAHVNGTISGDSAAGGCAVPNAPAGSQPLVAIDEQNQGVVGRGAAFTVNPVLVLTPVGASAGSPASPGTTVSVTGHGFAPSSLVSTLKFDSTIVTTTPGTVATDGNGNFSATMTFTVPANATAGNHTVSATDAAPNTGSGTLRVFAATVAASPTSGTPGAGLSINGAGWPAGDHVFIQIGSSSFDSNVVCSLNANATGHISGDAFSNSCAVPNAPAGSQTLVAIDEQNQGVVARGTAFTVKPVLVITPQSEAAGGPASPGTTLTINGHGFAASSTISTFKFDTTVVTTTPSSVSTDGDGNFTSTVTLVVPSTATAANHTVSATDGAAHTGPATIRVFRPTLTLSPTSGVPGAPLTVSGVGYPAGDRVFVQIGSAAFDSDVACSLTANLSGQISGDNGTDGCQVPDAPAGAQSAIGLDEQNQGVIGHASSFTVKPGLVLTPLGATAGAPASPGTTVAVGGHGFAAGGSVSTFKFGTAALATTPSTVGLDANGNFNSGVAFVVPASAPAGNDTVSASDGANTGTATLHVFRPTVVLSPTSGAPGAALTVSGTGWPAGDQIFIQIGSSSFDSDVACSITANLTGNISGDHGTNGCAVPSVGTGSQIVVGIDEQAMGVVARGASFNVT